MDVLALGVSNTAFGVAPSSLSALFLVACGLILLGCALRLLSETDDRPDLGWDPD
ncbi:MAG: hypothetical protein WC969_03720 [Elusimicrobiota bacterium]|jgi:hypothetical protein